MMLSIFIDELPDRCGKEIRRFFRKNGNGHTALAIKEKNKRNRKIWQVRIVPSDSVKHWLGKDRYYIVERSFQQELPFEWDIK